MYNDFIDGGIVIELRSILKKPQVLAPVERRVSESVSLEDRVYEIYGLAIQSALYSVCSLLGAPTFPYVKFNLEEQVIVIPSREELSEAGLLTELYDFSIKHVREMSPAEKASIGRDIQKVRELFTSGQKWHTKEMS